MNWIVLIALLQFPVDVVPPCNVTMSNAPCFFVDPPAVRCNAKATNVPCLLEGPRSAGLSVSTITSTLQLLWDPPPEALGQNLGYFVYHRSATDAEVTQDVRPSSTAATLTGLIPKREYTAQVSAYVTVRNPPSGSKPLPPTAPQAPVIRKIEP